MESYAKDQCLTISRNALLLHPIIDLQVRDANGRPAPQRSARTEVSQVEEDRRRIAAHDGIREWYQRADGEHGNVRNSESVRLAKELRDQTVQRKAEQRT